MTQRIVVLSSLGGHGHITTVKALREILGSEVELIPIYPINDLSFFGHTHLERFYNYFLRRNWTRAIGAISFSFARLFLTTNKRQIKEYIADHLDIIKPDLVISVIPFVNRHAIEVARSRGLNYLLITADNDLRHWTFDIDQTDLSHLEVTIGCDNRFTRQLLRSKGVPDEQIHTTGLPLRPGFTQKGKRPKRDAILMMLGGAGSKSALEFSQRLAQLNLPLDLYVTAGKNKKLFAKLQQMEVGDQTKLTPLDISANISDYMRKASLVIIKPGPMSTNEAMALEKPMLLDHTNGILVWEKMNSRIVTANRVGRPFYHIDELEELVPDMLSDERQEEIQGRYSQIEPSSFIETIPAIINRLSTSSPSR